MVFLGSFGILPTNLATGLDVALCGPGGGLAGLGLLGPARDAGDDDPAWPFEELVELMALMGVFGPEDTNE